MVDVKIAIGIILVFILFAIGVFKLAERQSKNLVKEYTERAKRKQEETKMVTVQHTEANGVNVVADIDERTNITIITVRRPDGELLLSISGGPKNTTTILTGTWDINRK